MQWQEFKNRIINLGFEEYDVFDENPNHIVEATNRANTLLHNTVEPNEHIYNVILPTDIYGNTIVNEVDMEEVEGFLKKSNKAPTQDNDVVDYYVQGNTYYITAKGSVSIPYVANLTKLDNPQETTDIDCREDLIPFLELLTAYYIWLDDDERKAVMYYNQFQEMLSSYNNSINSQAYIENMPKAKVQGGVDIG